MSLRQANDERFLCHIPAYNAVSEQMGTELVAAMEKILPCETLKKFYLAFRDADPTHALIQCVDIMSDDQVHGTVNLSASTNASTNNTTTIVVLLYYHSSTTMFYYVTIMLQGISATC